MANSYADGNGNRYITFPGSGWLGQGAAELMGLHGITVGSVPPAQFGGTLSSATIVFPMSSGVTPDVGPLASISAQALGTMFENVGNHFSSFRRPANVLVAGLNALDGHQGSYNQSIMEQLMPNSTIERIVQLYEAQHGGDEAFNSSVIQTYQMLAYMQDEATDKWIKDGAKGSPPQIMPTQEQMASNSAYASSSPTRRRTTSRRSTSCGRSWALRVPSRPRSSHRTLVSRRSSSRRSTSPDRYPRDSPSS